MVGLDRSWGFGAKRGGLRLGLAVVLMGAFGAEAAEWYVSPQGSDANPGTISRPFRSLEHAVRVAAASRSPEARTVTLRGGTYYLTAPLRLGPELAGVGKEPFVIRGYTGETAVVSGGRELKLNWTPYRNGIYQARVPSGPAFEELFVNGRRQVMARYPNFDPNVRIFNGFAADAIASDRVAQWANPAGGYFHAMHPAEWGDYTWKILGKGPNGSLEMEGGWQNNRPAGPHSVHRFVENIFEELDAPNEWYFERSSRTLYFYPEPGMDLATAKVEVAQLPVLVHVQGSAERPVQNIHLRHLTFRHAARTVMETKEPILRSDWAIARKGALLFEGAENCSAEDCFLDEVGGNAVFVSNYNRHLTFHRLHIARAGAGGIQFVGDPAAARSALFNYDQTQALERIDLTPGPRSNNFPSDCLVDDCLIYLTGRTEKQTAGINIDLSRSITVRHCSIYDMPRAGINIGDGCWGGHVIEYCDVFDTVKETGDHGSFNSWGRDRFWNPDIDITNRWVVEHPNMPFLDVQRSNVLRNNRWRCDHGWDIDLDDGSTNYEIYDNLCLNGGIKNREGYRRLVTNNIMVGNGFHPHVWYANSGDFFERNIVWQTYAPARMYEKPWKQLDRNILNVPGQVTSGAATALSDVSGGDANSVAGAVSFVNPQAGDYRVRKGSIAFQTGFRNFPMDRFGVQSPALRRLARTPSFSVRGEASETAVMTTVGWGGAKFRDVRDAQEASAFGMSLGTGVVVVEATGAWKPLVAGDVLQAIDGRPIRTVADLREVSPSPREVRVAYLHNQKRAEVTLKLR